MLQDTGYTESFLRKCSYTCDLAASDVWYHVIGWLLLSADILCCYGSKDGKMLWVESAVGLDCFLPCCERVQLEQAAIHAVCTPMEL